MSEQERQDVVQKLNDGYPLMALKSIVAFPHNRQALPIAREKTIRAIEEAMMQPEHILVAATQRSIEIDDPQPKDIYGTGTLIEVVTMHRQQDGTLQVLIRGINRVTIDEYVDHEPFIRAHVSDLAEPQTTGAQADALVRHTTSLFERYAQLNRRFSVEDINSIVALKTPPLLSDTLAAHVVTDMAQQQDLLETLDPMDRLEKICVIMGNEIEILELETTIRSRVRSQVDRSQKEFYLREQLRAIQEELGMETSSESDELRAKLNQKHLPTEAELKVRKEIDRLERTPSQSAELSVMRSYIDWVLALPWNERNEETFNIESARHILDQDHYGLEGIKERILEFLAVRELRIQVAQRNGNTKQISQGQILCLIGPPGVGKTSLGQSIAKALNRKFARISLGGVHDEAEIRGHRRTYVGALPGRIIQSMKTVGVRNPVFLLDEIDKLSSEYRGDPAAALLEVLDPQQNSNFTDHYLELPFDLSEVFFICTGNIKYQIPRPLADRMDIVDLPGYMLEEKVNIGTKHLIPKVLQEHGLTSEQLRIPQTVVQRVVIEYTREAGVRNLERQLASICRKAARRVLEKPNTHIRLTTHNLEQYLGAPRYTNAPPLMRTQIGAAIGLAWTEMGGILLPVEVVTMSGKGELLLTGQLGDVMRESVIAALSYIRTRTDELDIDPGFQDNYDLHIHLPEGGIPKDGPSAGITIATALVSALTRRPVRTDMAMTGEVTLLGSVLAIGGLKEKVLAAQQANIHTLIIPTANQKDLQDIPAKIRQQIHFTLVDNLDQVIEAALLPAPVEASSENNNTHISAPEQSAAAQEQGRHIHPPTSQQTEMEHESDPQKFFIPPPDPTTNKFFPSAHTKEDDHDIG
ncbi:endopeptidase La [Dictyobacter arantiisoli]|uniref:Lon protease n=1 Tax=Dictyobacter arantiisoli TaxID=2014874 RepID=A0A5A5T7A7_9CHLR|nr:endopeptidase La [Dictyobacter arantiisoli]GCF06814.1 Lon protease [Dictyobacter arantiisoli]